MVERTTYLDGEPCWADVVAPDLDAARGFYASLFGWEYQDTGPEFGNYTMALLRGRPVAALMPPPPGGSGVPAMWNLYLATADIDATAARAEAAGGKVVMGPMDIPGSGRMMAGFDPTGVAYGLWQPGGHVGAGYMGEPGTMSWAELNTRDGAAADAFYGGLFGFEQQQIGDGADFDYSVWSLEGTQVAGRMRVTDDTPPHWSVYFGVADADEAVAVIARTGGTVLFGPHDSPYGRLAGVTDPAGAPFRIVDQSRRAAG